jgi:hypothetical protein
MSREKPRIPTAEERLDKWMQMSIGTFFKIEGERQRIHKDAQMNPRDKWSRILQLTKQLREIADTCARVAEKDTRGKYDADKLRKIATALLKLECSIEKSRMTAGVDLDFQALLDKPVKNL